MTIEPPASSVEVSRRIIRLQMVTVVSMSVEAVLAIETAWHAHSTALFGFGGDSLIELLSAAVVFWRFRFRLGEKRAARIAGALLLVLAVFVVLTSILHFLGYEEAQRSFLGIVILLAAAVAMPLLAAQKRELARVTSSAALKADAAESALCGYMAWIAVAGLMVNAIWRKPWADPVAALLLVPIIVQEAWEAIRGNACQDC